MPALDCGSMPDSVWMSCGMLTASAGSIYRQLDMPRILWASIYFSLLHAPAHCVVYFSKQVRSFHRLFSNFCRHLLFLIYVFWKIKIILYFINVRKIILRSMPISKKVTLFSWSKYVKLRTYCLVVFIKNEYKGAIILIRISFCTTMTLFWGVHACLWAMLLVYFHMYSLN